MLEPLSQHRLRATRVAGDPDVDEIDPALRALLMTRDRLGPLRVAAVDDHVPLREQPKQLFDRLLGRIAGRPG